MDLSLLKMLELPLHAQLAAAVIQQQHPAAIRWAARRQYEFVSLIDERFGLAPSRHRHGFGWAGGYTPDEDDLVYFDQMYDDMQHADSAEGVWMRVSLQMCEGRQPATFIELRLSLDEPSENAEVSAPQRCYGDIRLTGSFGKRWELQATMASEDSGVCAHLRESFGPFLEFSDNSGSIAQRWFGKPYPATVRELFYAMTEYYLARRA